jgi:LysR family transcriptional regulator, mexEF-oprN operon transcriptional activator
MASATHSRKRARSGTRAPKLSAIDLNLLVAFEALWAERSVTRAGRRLGLSQPATSGALSRLRTMFDDELFVRGRGGLEPTERCAVLAGRVVRTLADLREAIDGDTFEPATSERIFRVGAVDAVLAVVLPHVIARLLERAPRARLIITPIDPGRAVALLEQGELDLALVAIGALPTTVGARALFPLRGVVAMRPQHPCARHPDRLTLADLSRYPQIMVSFVGPARSAVDDALARDGKQRHIAVVLGSFLAVPSVLRESDVFAILPEPFARTLEARGEVVVAPLPAGVPFPTLHMRMLWPLAQDVAAASRWLRELVVEGVTAAGL